MIQGVRHGYVAQFDLTDAESRALAGQIGQNWRCSRTGHQPFYAAALSFNIRQEDGRTIRLMALGERGRGKRGMMAIARRATRREKGVVSPLLSSSKSGRSMTISGALRRPKVNPPWEPSC
eukprot:scaffold13177_cov70-Cyclotella_meneghiniana.AAC.4